MTHANRGTSKLNIEELFKGSILKHFKGDTEQAEIAWMRNSKTLTDGTILFAMEHDDIKGLFIPCVITADKENAHWDIEESFDTIKRTLDYAERWKEDLV